jgi:hypothetical protein
VRAEASLLAFCRTPETIALAVHQVTVSEANGTWCWDATIIGSFEDETFSSFVKLMRSIKEWIHTAKKHTVLSVLLCTKIFNSYVCDVRNDCQK